MADVLLALLLLLSVPPELVTTGVDVTVWFSLFSLLPSRLSFKVAMDVAGAGMLATVLTDEFVVVSVVGAVAATVAVVPLF